jgi:phosphatidate cytidylyltransferase
MSERADAPIKPVLPQGRWADLGVRAVSAALLIPAVLLDVWQGGIWFEVFMAFFGVLIAHEWSNIVHNRNSAQFALHAAAAIVAAFLPKEIGVLPAVGMVLMLTAIGIFTASLREGEKTVWTYAGIPYVAFPVLSLVMLRHNETWGIHAIMWLLLVVWATDTFAYFTGRAIGGPKLSPRFSPNKTWAGLLGGMAGAAAVSAIYAQAMLVAVIPLAVTAAVLAVCAQIGDIFESALKRHFGIKDSGNLIPGHGGVMDRVDGMVFASCAAAVIGFVRAPGSLAQGLLLW